MSTATEREKAFERFNQLAEQKQADGTESLEMRRLVLQFNTAPAEERDQWLSVLNSAMRSGDTESMKVFGDALFTWAQENGYGALTYASLTTFLMIA